ncbi:Hermansky-Pudlak syndrome 3 protein [Pristis pectinata]|uniref:Hermansky-Pudlak syndrome 3 protein n=1 Tax=Pristis pectinata TaxID=685728 RepID=UPI00223CEE89|nr:Hermansky-Pudlak syndrome 3 protein [Pristis pectinata]XP_051874726.1 Hermansky-Pudlak syndrome 3 protein [Pristis pectinata]
MVRVYNCHPFSSQLIVPIEHEPDTFCCGRDILFVISAGCKVETFNVAQNGYEPLCAFATLGKVQKITYSDIGDYLAVIEEKSKVLSLRVYFNWRKCQAKETSRVSIRMVGHALRAPFIGVPKDQMEIIEVPLSEPPVSISCCPVKGDLTVGCQNKVVLFRLKEEMVDGESPVLDFERFLIVHVALDLLEVAFCNGCLAMVADLEVLVLKLEYVQQVEGKSWLQVPQKAAPTNEGVYGVENKPAEGASLSQEQDEFVLFQGPLELLGEDASGSGVLISSEWTGMEGLNTELQSSLHLRQILYRRFAPDLSHIYLDEKTSLHSVQLLPIFSAGDLESNSSPVRKEKQVLSLFCFFSLPHIGYLYSVGNMVQELSTYSYPEKANQAVLTSQLLHVITRNNLLCYSVRCSAVAARDIDPEIDTNNKACPPFFLPVSALRMQLFIGLRAVCHSRNHLILLAKAEVNAQKRQNESKKGSPQKSRTVNNTTPITGESGWNLYCLQVIPTVQLCKEMVEYSLKYKTCSPQSYVHLLSEAHLMLKAALLDPDLGQCDSELLSAFSENCIQLGDCFSQFEMDDFHLTLPYYKMSGKSLSDLISRRLLWENEPEKFGKGFMYYLKHLVYEEIEEPLSAETANQVLQVFRLSEPTQIPHALCSPCMRNVCLRTAWDHLERLASISPSPLVTLTKAMVALRIEDQQKYQEAMGRYTEMRLVNGFVDEPNLLRHHSVVATELSHKLQRTQPGLLVVAFVALLKNDKITLAEADLFFKELCGKGDKDDEAETPQMLVDFWEATLISCTEEVMIELLLMKLVSVYLHRTVRRLKPDQKPLKTVEELISSCGHFGKIFPWIHTINASSSEPLGPSEDLQKLQSILCGPSIEITSVLHLLQHLPDDDMTGLSIHALCDTRLGKCEHVTDLLLDRCPEALLPFATCEMQQGNQPLWWKKLLPELCERTRGAGGENRILVSSLQETLAVVAAALPPLDFLRILPDDGVASFFLPHLLECSRKNSIT